MPNPATSTAMKMRPAARWRSKLRSSHDGSTSRGGGRSRGTSGSFDAAGAPGRCEVPPYVSVGALDQCGGIDHQLVIFEAELVTVHAPGRRALDVLTGEIEDRTVARALEPPGAVAERHTAAEVGTLLGEGEVVAAGVGHVEAGSMEVSGRAGAEPLGRAQRERA